MKTLSGIVYVMRVIGEDRLVKVGMTKRDVVARFGKNGRYGRYLMECQFTHWFEDVAVAEREIHALLHYARVDRSEMFQVTPTQAQGAVLWYACEMYLNPPQPRRELRMYRTYAANRDKAMRYGVSI